jgi:hypothetical protein
MTVAPWASGPLAPPVVKYLLSLGGVVHRVEYLLNRLAHLSLYPKLEIHCLLP